MQINDGKLKFHTQSQRNFQLVNVYIMSNIGSQVKDLKMNRTGNTKKHTQISSKGKSRGRKEEEKSGGQRKHPITAARARERALLSDCSRKSHLPRALHMPRCGRWRTGGHLESLLNCL